MESIRIDILNPKVKKLLKNLADLQLIRIKKDEPTDFPSLLKKIRSNTSTSLTIEEITNEVETVRKSRNEK